MVKPVDVDLSALTFQGKDPEERLEFYFRQHWIRLLWPIIKVSFISLILAAFGIFFATQIADTDAMTRRFSLVIVVILFLIAQFDFLLKFYRYFLYVVVVTDRKIHRIKKTLFVFDDHHSIDIWMLQDINRIQHGVVQNLLHFGTLKMEAQDTVIRLHFVPSIERKYEKLMNLRERARARMSYNDTLLGRQRRQS